MKVLKSPVFYFGIVLALVVGLALLAPFVVDWGRYRADLEGWGQKLTGREVAIRGDISVKLFPFPQLTAQDVVIANPDGFREPVFATLERVRVQVTLGGLLSGELQVESIELDNPVATLVRMQGNKINWQFESSAAFRNSAMLEKVRLDQIKLTGGTITILDEVRQKRGQISGLAATVSAPSLAGPWRSTGAFEFNSTPLTYTLSTAVWAPDRPLRFALRLTPTEQAGYSAVVEGEKASSGQVKGEIRVAPVEDAEGKSNSEGQFRAVTLKASYIAGFDRIDLQGIEIRPADTKDQGTLITGKASADIGNKISTKIDISAPRVDLDGLAGAGSRQLLRDGGGLALINGLLAGLPKELELEAKLKVLALRAGGETLENAELAFSTTADAVEIRQFSAALPGRSRVLFSGVFFPGERFAELGGKISLESLDARQLASWLSAQNKGSLAKVWAGSRGRLKAQSEVRLTVSKLEFRDISYELDGSSGNGRVAVLVNGERPILDVEIRTERLDVDSFLPQGIGSLSPGGMRWTWLLSNFLAEQSRRDMRLVLDARQLLLNGVDARDVAASIETTVRGVDIKTLSVASVGGSSFKASGVMLNTESGADGEIRMTVAAEDPRGLLRLAGLLPRERDPAWSRPLGRTDISIALKAQPGDAAGSIGLSAHGSSGPFSIELDGTLSEVLSETVRINAGGRIDSRNAADLWRLLGGDPKGPDGPAGALTLQVDGFVGGDMKVATETSLQGAKIAYRGSLVTASPAYSGEGDLSLDSEDSTGLLRMLGMAIVEERLPAISAKSKVSFGAEGVSLSGISGTAAGGPIAGELKLAGDTLSGDISIERMVLSQALAAVFLPWDGDKASSESLLAAAPPFGLKGELWIKPRLLDVYPGYTVPDGQIGITSKGQTTQFVAYGKDQTGQRLSVELQLDTSLAQRKVTGSAALPFRLESVLEGTDGARPLAGTAAIDVKFSGQGLSPAAVLADLSGGGAFQATGAKLTGISPEQFTASIGQVRDAESLQASLRSMEQGQGLSFSPVFGAVELLQGVAKVTPFNLATADADVVLSPVVDLAQRIVRISVAMDLKALPGLPRMSITYEGEPATLARRQDISELSAHLGFKVLQQGVDELEKVQAEQARLAREEEEMRKADQLRLEQFYAQRTELRLRQRELRTFAAQRVIDAELEQKRIAALVAGSRQMIREELARRSRELATFGRPLGGTTAAPPILPRIKPDVPSVPAGDPASPG